MSYTDCYQNVKITYPQDRSADQSNSAFSGSAFSASSTVNPENEALKISKGSSSRTFSTTNTTTAEASSGKRRKYLTASRCKCISIEERLNTLNEYSGKNNIIDMTKPNIIHKRLRKVTEKMLARYELVLKTRLVDEEYDLIMAISTYLLTREHHEDWFRMNVYGDLFDFAFISKSNYTTKRTECHSSVVKQLKRLGLLPDRTKDVKLDFIFSHMNSEVDYWSTLLFDPQLIRHLTAFSCQFNKLKLKAKATKIISGISVHILLKQVSIPHNAQDGLSIAEYLVTVISLVRMIAENYEKLKIMMDIVRKDDLVFGKYYSKDLFIDSTISSASSSQSSGGAESLRSSVAESNEFDEERRLRISQNIEAALEQFSENSSKRCFNCTWDNINIPHER
ncbi:hypothetical protein [Parasitella parasitica]|uniref:Uncharacterized protein n=1 Tax=Parasitella parasitica TaxID=35722 RepID=A0A0B7MYA7_9FUNG|nr:hypothetical protein [Parasitella parasitica]